MKIIQGFVGTNKQGLTYKVLDAQRMHHIRIQFDDGTEVTTTNTYLEMGLPLHPTKYRMLPGLLFTDKRGNEFELVEKINQFSWRIRFKKDGIECTRDTKAIKAGTVTHPTDGKAAVGNTYKTRHGRVTVIEVKSAIDVTVQFEDGSTTKTTASDLRKNLVGHPTSGLFIGQQLATNSNWNYTIEKYISPYEVHCRMQDGSLEIVTAKNAKFGGFKPVMQPSVCDVGYVGQGRFTSGIKVKGEDAPEKIYAYWHRMIGRCFNPNEIVKSTGRRYIFVSVNKEWFNFQNFAEWAIRQPNWNLGYELDKDLLGNGWEYSESNCTFLPADVNIFLSENWKKDVHDLPIGVNYLKPGTSGAKVGYVSRCHTAKGREYLGYFDDPMDAHYAYKKAKEAYARVLAEKYKDTLTKESYEKLSNFTLDKIYADNPPYQCSSLST